MAYSVIMVDDEPWAIIDILHSVDWSAAEFRVIGTYEKSREAALAIIDRKPDVVFTDIKMPGMDGFELITECRQAGAEAEFVILSSYSDFSYAKQAIKASVVDYCLKPINPEVLNELLGRLYVRLNEKNALTADEITQDQFERILSYVRANYDKRLLLSDISEQFSFHRNYICHLFKKNLGVSFTGYVNELRIDEAKKLLCHTALSVEEIASRFGIDYYYFNKVFKKQMRETPSTYRKKNAKEHHNP